MSKFIFMACVIALFVVPVSAQWLPQPYNGTDNIYFEKNVGIGGQATSNSRLRLFSPTGSLDSPGGASQLSFASAGAARYAWRLDSANNLHLDKFDSPWLSPLTVTYNAGKVGVNTSTPTAQLEVATEYGMSQLTLGKKTMPGAMSFSVWVADSLSIGLDARFTNNAWFAEHSTIAFLSKNNNQVKISGSAGNTAGLPIQPITEHFIVDLVGGRVGNTMTNINDNTSLSLSARAFGWLTSGPGYAVGVENTDTGNTSSGLLVKTAGTGSVALHVLRGTSSLLAVRSDGRVGIGTSAPIEELHVVGDAKITGALVVDGPITGAKVFNAVFQDLAEWVPASEDMLPGTVVVLDPTTSNQVMPSHRAYDTTVAGVISAQPGILLGVGAATKEQVATTGRVKVMVDASRGAIAIGDILVTSDRHGMAMKSQPIDVSGISIHRPGTVIGKALEPLANGEGEILVLLSLQ